MATAQLDGLRQMFNRVRDAADGDGELLTRYRTLRDQDAFGSLVRRHAPMVLGVCRRVLRDLHAADDAFQATFLVLAKKADAVRPPDRLGPWLYGVAYRTALKARGRSYRRRQVEEAYAARMAGGSPCHDGDDLTPVIDEQLNALPEKYRDPLVLCALQGLNKAQAAERLGLPEGTISSRLARAREMLRDRLTRRGVVVPTAALATLLTADTLQAAAPPALVASTVHLVVSHAVPSTILYLSHEVIRSMTLLKLKFLGTIALSVSLAGGGLGLVALQADDPKPVKPSQSKPEKPDGQKPKPETPDGQKPAVKPDGKKVRKMTGQVGKVDGTARTIMLLRMGEGGLREDAVHLLDDAKVEVDGKEVKLDAVSTGTTAGVVIVAFGKDGAPPEASVVSIDQTKLVWVVKEASTSGVTLLGGGRVSQLPDRVIKLAPGGKVVIDGKSAKTTDLQPGDLATITLNADHTTASLITVGLKTGRDGDKPGVEKPAAKPGRFAGKIAAVDVAARTVSLAAKGDGGRAIVVKLTPDARITVDGKEAKLADLPKGAIANLHLSSAKDGQLREANEATVAGPTFNGTVKQIDGSSITIGNEKTDRVFKLATIGRVVIGAKDGKTGDLKVGDCVSVTLSTDGSSAVLIVAGAKKPGGEKPKPGQEDE